MTAYGQPAPIFNVVPFMLVFHSSISDTVISLIASLVGGIIGCIDVCIEATVAFATWTKILALYAESRGYFLPTKTAGKESNDEAL
jgi:hypothetical protein